MNVVIYPYSIEHSYIKEYKKLFRYNIIYFMCYGNILLDNKKTVHNSLDSSSTLSHGKNFPVHCNKETLYTWQTLSSRTDFPLICLQSDKIYLREKDCSVPVQKKHWFQDRQWTRYADNPDNGGYPASKLASQRNSFQLKHLRS